jgi:hypothetical protein
MPIVIFGTKGKAVPDHEASGFSGMCRNCGQTVLFEPVRMKQYVSLFFVPLIPLGKGKAAVRCPNCDTKYERQEP